MAWGAIATWRMAHDGVIEAMRLLEKKGKAGDAVETLIKTVEDYPYYKSVGFGGLPNVEGILEMDAPSCTGIPLKLVQWQESPM